MHKEWVPMPGTTFGEVAYQAYDIALHGNASVEFKFNGVRVIMLPYNTEKEEIYK